MKTTNAEAKFISDESSRIEEVYRKREIEIDKDLYAPWQPAENFTLFERRRAITEILSKIKKFPKRNDKCLEIGYGKIGWLADLIHWGLKETDLYGIELDAKRAAVAQQALPNAELKIGDATNLPWEKESFNFVIVSTVFSSILNQEVREMVAGEINRVLTPGGVLIWYDLAVNNPKNSDVQGINKNQLKQLFPNFKSTVKSITLAPPIARFAAPKSVVLTSILNSLLPLRTHLIGTFEKN